MTDMPDEVIVCNPTISMNNGCSVRMCISGDVIGTITGENIKYTRSDIPKAELSKLRDALDVAERALSVVWRGDKDNYGFKAEIDCRKMDEINEALTAIKQARGEG